jgi:hypothetical protein
MLQHSVINMVILIRNISSQYPDLFIRLFREFKHTYKVHILVSVKFERSIGCVSLVIYSGLGNEETKILTVLLGLSLVWA